jgi:Putative transposase
VRSLRTREWYVYAKPPFAGPQQVLAYLGRYTHRVAISNHRLRSCKDGVVTFTWKDYAHGNYSSLLPLSADEFIRRFLLHVLPHGFQRLRQFGLLANRHRRSKLTRCRLLLDKYELPDSPQLTLKSLLPLAAPPESLRCPVCNSGTMQRLAALVPTDNLPQLVPLPAPPILDSS